MFSGFENMSIKVKLVMAFLMVALFAGTLGVVSVMSIDKIKKADEFMFKEVAIPLAELREITQAFLMNRILTRSMIASTEPEEREEIIDTVKDNIKSLETKTASYEKLMTGAEEKQAYSEFKAAYDSYIPLLNQMIEMTSSGKTNEALDIARGPATKSANLMMRGLDKVSAVSVKEAKSTAERNEKIATTAKIISTIFSIAAVAAAIIIGLIVSARLTAPLCKLGESFQKVASGDLTVSVFTGCCDEIGSLSISFQKMVEQLRDLITQVSKTSSTVASATTELQNTSETIARGAETAAAQTITVATASEEMAATSHDIANSCQIAVDGAQRANETARTGAEVVSHTVDGMRRIAKRVQDTAQTVDSLGERSDQIGAIVATIEDIADQTNLLALNAAIEAARAGEMGRGFAVVADEVRALAERTTKATREIGEMIRAIQSETRSAVNAMNEGVREVEAGTEDAERSGSALQQILNEIDAVTEQVRQISTSAEEQSVTTGEITDNIHKMTDVIQETARGSHDTADAASNLSSLSENLEKIVSRFRLS